MLGQIPPDVAFNFDRDYIDGIVFDKRKGQMEFAVEGETIITTLYDWGETEAEPLHEATIRIGKALYEQIYRLINSESTVSDVITLLRENGIEVDLYASSEA